MPSPFRGRRLAGALAASFAVLAISIAGGDLSAEFRIDRAIARLEAARASDRAFIERAVNHVLETQISDTVVDWLNPDSGSRGTVTPVRTFRGQNGEWCREYRRITVMHDGGTESRRAITCREPGGAWKTRAELFIDS